MSDRFLQFESQPKPLETPELSVTLLDESRRVEKKPYGIINAGWFVDRREADDPVVSTPADPGSKPEALTIGPIPHKVWGVGYANKVPLDALEAANGSTDEYYGREVESVLDQLLNSEQPQNGRRNSMNRLDGILSDWGADRHNPEADRVYSELEQRGLLPALLFIRMQYGNEAPYVFYTPPHRLDRNWLKTFETGGLGQRHSPITQMALRYASRNFDAIERSNDGALSRWGLNPFRDRSSLDVDEIRAHWLAARRGTEQDKRPGQYN